MIRIGHSFDIHKLKVGKGFKLGGIEIQSNKAVVAHSDGDCLLHAISESFLGALGLGDLGDFYPDNISETKDMDSSVMLKEVYDKLRNKGYHLQNIDCMIYLEFPKLKPYKARIQNHIANLLAISPQDISIKATTFEGMGDIGRNDAIAASCVSLIKKQSIRKL